MQRQQQQQQYPNNHYESSENNQTELHRFGQNADRFTTSGGTNITTVRSDFFLVFSCPQPVLKISFMFNVVKQ